MAFRFSDPEGDARMAKGLHPATGKPDEYYKKNKVIGKFNASRFSGKKRKNVTEEMHEAGKEHKATEFLHKHYPNKY